MKNRSYSELKRLRTYEERLNYLKLNGVVGSESFGFDRYLNQRFYNSVEWKRVRNEVILRDGGNDLGVEDNPIPGRIYIHHMNPLTLDDLNDSTDNLMNPEYLISVSRDTHNAIHYGSDPVRTEFAERQPNDTCPWRK